MLKTTTDKDAPATFRAASTPYSARPRLLIFVVAYHARRTIENVLSRIPASLAEDYQTEVLVIDDASTDGTFRKSQNVVRRRALSFPVRVLFNPVNQGYGGNQKIGYHYAIRRGFDYVALLHGDGQYAPECLPDLVRPLRMGVADACFGSRMLTPAGARRGGMPLYKLLGNRILTWCQNRLLGTRLSEFHSGYRVYCTKALSRLPFDLNTNDFHFDTEIIIQFLIAGFRIVERPIPTYYGDEICRIAGLRYARDVMRAVVRAKAQELGIFYDRRFDCASKTGHQRYIPKLDFNSPHLFALKRIPRGSRVLDLGCAGGLVGDAIRRAGNYVVGIDKYPPDQRAVLDEFCQHDLNSGLPPAARSGFDYVLLLDVIEHLYQPELFISELRRVCSGHETRIIVSTGNIGFLVTRLMLLAGQFNYGKRGILDLTHTRLFTFLSFKRFFEQYGFKVLEMHGVPAPFPLITKRKWLGRFLLALNAALIKLSRRFFAYQIVMVVTPYPSLDTLLAHAEASGGPRSLSA
jgi:glycosyltransferase involved in cell wall biosynthesis